MPLETKDRYAWAVLWPKLRNDAFGEPVLSTTPVSLRVRWNNKTRRVLQPDGSTVAYDASVVANRMIAEDSVMWQGNLQDITDEDTGVVTPPTSNLFSVKSMDKTEDIKGRFARYELMLMRYKDDLPTGT